MHIARPRLTVSILAFLSCLLILTWLLFSLFALRTAANDLYAQKGQHARMLLDTFVSQLPETIPTFPEGLIPPESAAARFAQQLAGDGTIVRLTLLDANGKPVYSAGTGDGDVFQPFQSSSRQPGRYAILPGGSAIVTTIPVARNGAVVATAGLCLSLDSENARIERSRTLFMAYFALDFILLLGFGSFILSRIVVRPVNRLLAATERITGGQYGQRVHVSGSAELARLADAFNAMSENLQLKDRQVKAHVAALERANSDLSQARAESVRSEKMASIGLLAAGMAHEVGTPLASIMGYAELLSGEPHENPAIRDYARRITLDCARIDRIVRGLLDYARTRNSTAESVDVRQLTLDSVELLSQQGAFKRIEVTTLFDEALPLAQADPHQLQQVLINLMLNGRDAMPGGGKLAIRARFSTEPASSGRQDGCVCIDVMDSGTGISPEHLKRIFDPFFTTKSPGKGTGLGLAISARIMEGFGGRITVRSKQETGSCFTLRLPVAVSRGEAS